MQKAIDIVKPVCPNAHQHRHLRRVLDTFPQAFISDRVVMLKVDHPHVCKARIIIEQITPIQAKRPLGLNASGIDKA